MPGDRNRCWNHYQQIRLQLTGRTAHLWEKRAVVALVQITFLCFIMIRFINMVFLLRQMHILFVDIFFSDFKFYIFFLLFKCCFADMGNKRHCNHFCKNKAFCAHDCCEYDAFYESVCAEVLPATACQQQCSCMSSQGKVGVTVTRKRSANQETSFTSYLKDLRSRCDTFAPTPVKRLKVSKIPHLNPHLILSVALSRLLNVLCVWGCAISNQSQ